MAKSIRKCKVCGKEYEYCKTWLSVDKFRWQDVACSPECGAIYFSKVEAARSANAGGEIDEARPTQSTESVEATESASVETAVEHKESDAVGDEPDVVKAPKRSKRKAAKALSE